MNRTAGGRPSARRVLTLMALAGGMLVGPALAASTSVGDGSSKVTITGDSFVVEDAKHEAVFSGNVVVIQTQVKVNADKVVAHLGTDSGHSIQSFEATGHVVLMTKDQRATGDRAVFDPKTHLLRLTGNVVVTNATGTVRSEALVVDLAKNTSHFTGGGGGGRVTGVFTSQ